MLGRAIRQSIGGVLLGLPLLMLSAPSATASATHVPRGGTLNVDIMNVAWPELEPATDPHATTDIEFMNAIYGSLFLPEPHGAIGYDMATGYKFSDGNQKLTITLRPGMVFSDGTAFNAQAVEDALTRDINPANACDCLDDFSVVKKITTSGRYTVSLDLSRPDPILISAFIDDAPNWIPSPTSLAEEGLTTFGQKPVGAGPFVVASDFANQKINLVRNPRYWEKGHPYLSGINFTDVGLDQSALNDLQSGGAQMVVGVTTPTVIQEAKGDGLQVTQAAGISGSTIEFNTTRPPMNNVLAREAVTYATNAKQLMEVASPNYGALIEDQQGPGGAYFERKVPGYRSYNLAKAKALVQQLGGLNLTIGGVAAGASLTLLEAVQTQLKQAGINVTINPTTLNVYEANFASGSWQAVIGGAGEADPDIGQAGLPRRFGGGGSYSCCNDPTLNGMILQSEEYASPSTRAKLFNKIFAYIAKEDYVDELYIPPVSTLSSRSVSNLVTIPSQSGDVYIDWQDLYLK